MMVTMAMMVAMTLLVGVLVAATPWLMPPTECFAVTVPPSAQRDPRIRGYKSTFAKAIVAVSLIFTAVLIAVMLRVGNTANPTNGQLALLTTAIMAAVLAPIVLSYALLLHYRGRVRELKHSQGWEAQAQRAAVIVDEDVPKPISLVWNLAYVPIVLAMIAFGLANYDLFPERIPMNMDMSGHVNTYVAKSVGSVLFPAITTMFMAFVFVITHVGMLRSKRPIDPAAPASSAYAYGRFARLQSQTMLVMGLVLCTTIGVSFYLSSLGVISMAVAGLAMGGVTLLIVFGVAAVSVVTGQAGGRIAGELRSTDALERDDDRYWPLGVFYANADDPSIVVPKRFGVGWTVNIARPASWLVMIGMIVVTVAFVLLVNWAVGQPL